jgi:hypothetical protein
MGVALSSMIVIGSQDFFLFLQFSLFLIGFLFMSKRAVCTKSGQEPNYATLRTFGHVMGNSLFLA